MSLTLPQLLQHKAEFYQTIRQFFLQRQVLEVDTPLLASAAVTDLHIDPLTTSNSKYLQTSPEYAMKRLLSAGSGDIFQLAHAFRDEPSSAKHRAEFSLLEWYRLGFDQWALMEEVAELLELLLGVSAVKHLSYRQVFDQYLGIDPFTISDAELMHEARQHIEVQMGYAQRDDWLSLLMSHLIEPELGRDLPTFIYDYPPSQAALARVQVDEQGVPVAQRFELYYRGLELCNGYHELADAAQLSQRFALDNQQRLRYGKPELPLDQAFLQAMQRGLPECAGVAVGLDRLLMLSLNSDDIADTLPLSFC